MPTNCSISSPSSYLARPPGQISYTSLSAANLGRCNGSNFWSVAMEQQVVDWKGLKALGIPYSRAHIWRLMNSDDFPRAFKLGKHRNSHVQAMGFSNLSTGLVVALFYVAGMVAMILWGSSSDRRGERVLHIVISWFVMATGLLVVSSAQNNIIVLMALALAVVGQNGLFWPFLHAVVVVLKWASSREQYRAGQRFRHRPRGALRAAPCRQA